MEVVCVANNQSWLEKRDWSSVIDSFDVVVRYGLCRQLGTTAGRKVDYLFLHYDRSCIDPAMQCDERIHIIAQQKPVIVLAWYRHGIEHLREWLGKHGVFKHCPLMLLPGLYRLKAEAELKRLKSTTHREPSIGIVVNEFLREHFKDHAVHTFGFDHSGSDFHDWSAERRYFDEKYKNKELIKWQAQAT